MAENKEVHVVMLPWLAFGHMIPFLDLSIALAKCGVRVSYVSTPRNIERLPRIPQNLSELINYVPISLPKLISNPLPKNAEASMDITFDQIGSLKIAYDLLQDPIKNFIAETSPDWILVDFFQHWAIGISQELSIPLITYLITPASTALFFWGPEFVSGLQNQYPARKSVDHFTVPPPWVDFPSEVAYKTHEAVVVQNLVCGGDNTGTSDGARVANLIHNSRAVAIRTNKEFESEYLKQYSKVIGKDVLPVGFLPPEAEGITKDEAWIKVFDWFDKQKQEAVVFVGFGSEYKLTKVEIHEIAFGLELSGVPFFWSLRKPEWADDDDDEDGILPSGFSARAAEREQGMVNIGWAPQREILAHPSIGGSLFHAGWGSTIECLLYGHRLLLLPFIIDQPLGARLMVEKGLGIEVERDDDGSFTRNDIADAVRKGMVSEEGKRLRARAKEAARRLFGNRELNDEHIDKFAEYLKNGSKGKG